MYIQCTVIDYDHYSFHCSSCPILTSESPSPRLLSFFRGHPISLWTGLCFRAWQNIADLLCRPLPPDLELVLEGTLVPFSTSQYMCVVTTLKKQNWLPTPNLVGMSSVKTEGTQEEGGKVYYLLNETFWVEQGRLHKMVWKTVCESWKETGGRLYGG